VQTLAEWEEEAALPLLDCIITYPDAPIPSISARARPTSLPLVQNGFGSATPRATSQTSTQGLEIAREKRSGRGYGPGSKLSRPYADNALSRRVTARFPPRHPVGPRFSDLIHDLDTLAEIWTRFYAAYCFADPALKVTSVNK